VPFEVFNGLFCGPFVIVVHYYDVVCEEAIGALLLKAIHKLCKRLWPFIGTDTN
jgi:hypothetical protein